MIKSITINWSTNDLICQNTIRTVLQEINDDKQAIQRTFLFWIHNFEPYDQNNVSHIISTEFPQYIELWQTLQILQ